jgi:hypothetical protein
MGPEALAQVLQPLRGMFPEARYPELLVGLAGADNATNAMSDVYAMGEEAGGVLARAKPGDQPDDHSPEAQAGGFRANRRFHREHEAPEPQGQPRNYEPRG